APTLHIERARVGNSPPKVARAALLPDGDRFQPQLRPGVDMTSDVKGWVAIRSTCSSLLAVLLELLSSGRGGASKRRRLVLLLSVGWLPPSVRPSGAGLALGTRVSGSL